MRVLVCGGREYGAYNKVAATLEGLSPSIIIQGGASGADQLALSWARQNRVVTRTFHADWETHGKAAGPIRNQKMLDEGKPDLVVAFPGGRGTADMVRRAHEAGIRVIEAGK
jgi:predicted Rossmann-fold nucleotide-binding protein